MDTDWTEFKIGARVFYSGTFTPAKKGQLGTVVGRKPYTDTDNGPSNINVLWDDGEKFMGVFPENLSLLDRKAKWEL
jgi:hypothetical protein